MYRKLGSISNFTHQLFRFIPPLRRPAVQIVQPAREQDLTGLHATKKASCVAEITPECLQALYRIPTAPATGSGSIAVSGFLSEVASQSDLDVSLTRRLNCVLELRGAEPYQAFLDKFRPDTTNSTFSVQTLDGGSNEGNGTAEAVGWPCAASLIGCHALAVDHHCRASTSSTQSGWQRTCRPPSYQLGVRIKMASRASWISSSSCSSKRPLLWSLQRASA